MNQVIQVLLSRKSVRAYDERPISEEVKAEIIAAALRAPTAGNMMLYSIVEVKDQSAKDTLAVTCDNQPFIAKAPLVLLFLADCQRWWDYFKVSGVEELARAKGEALRKPQEGDLLIACCDALIAAETAVIAAESLGVGSCYIGDIMENYETHRVLFDLPPYALPICLVCFGYPTKQQQERPLTPRFDQKFIVFENRYKRLGKDEFAEMYREREARLAAGGDHGLHGIAAGAAPAANVGQLMYLRKFSADFSKEMTRSVRAMLDTWRRG
ncbi:MAG TPA: nitroreductase family protein [bacterium]|nr:nitroreductase family protein [bacterium]